MSQSKKLGNPQWKKGQSGNPAGKPKGTMHKATRVALALMEGEANDIVKAVVQKAKEGDVAAARLILERLVPPVKEMAVHIELPDTSTAEGINAAQGAILAAVACGELLPTEARTLAGIVDDKRRALELNELEQRITALEKRNEKSQIPD